MAIYLGMAMEMQYISFSMPLANIVLNEGLTRKHCVPHLLLPSILDAQFGTPYPRSAGFDTDIGAFIESSTVSSP